MIHATVGAGAGMALGMYYTDEFSAGFGLKMVGFGHFGRLVMLTAVTGSHTTGMKSI